MPWVQRTDGGNVCGLYANKQPGYAEEFLDGDNAHVIAFLNPVKPETVFSQDMMAQFNADDAAKIQAAIAGVVQFWLLWQALTTQKDSMLVTNARFKAGWSALVQVLGQPRMDEIAAALGVTVA